MHARRPITRSGTPRIVCYQRGHGRGARRGDRPPELAPARAAASRSGTARWTPLFDLLEQSLHDELRPRAWTTTYAALPHAASPARLAIYASGASQRLGPLPSTPQDLDDLGEVPRPPRPRHPPKARPPRARRRAGRSRTTRPTTKRSSTYLYRRTVRAEDALMAGAPRRRREAPPSNRSSEERGRDTTD